MIKFLFVIILTLSSIVTGIFALSTLTYSGGDKAYCAKLYYDGKYSVVEGVVYDLEEDIKTQMYYVDGECFLVGPNEDALWDIKENGQQVRISYDEKEELIKVMNFSKNNTMQIMFITEDKDSIIAQIPNWIKYDNNRVA